jgi:hypothetical protein
MWEDGRVWIVPHPDQRRHIVRHAHEELGHFGVKRTYNLLLGQYWWCRNPTSAKCGGEAQHLEKLEVGSLPGLPNVQSSTARGKTPRIGVFLVSLESS